MNHGTAFHYAADGSMMGWSNVNSDGTVFHYNANGEFAGTTYADNDRSTCEHFTGEGMLNGFSNGDSPSLNIFNF